MGLAERLRTVGERVVDTALRRVEASLGIEGPPPPAPAIPQTTYPPLEQRGIPQADEVTEFVKALEEQTGQRLNSGELPLHQPKSLFQNPLELVEQLGYKERYNALAYPILARMARQATPIGTIVHVRVNQIAQFCRPQLDPHKLGFKIRKKDWKSKSPTKRERTRAEELTQVMMRCTVDPEPGIGQPNFESFTRAMAWDSLVYDQGNAEILPSRNGKPHSWLAVDAATIRLADTKERFYLRDKERGVRTVQVLGGQPINEYRADEMMFWVRNPRTDIRGQGYGCSEVEDLTSVIASLIFGFKYNSAFFTQGAAPKGMLNFKGTVPGRQLAAFRKHFYAMISGVENAWRVPVVNAEGGVDWISMQSSNRDMEFSSWIDFQLKLACARFLMDPLEIGFKYGNEGDRSLFESANQQKVTESKDKGLKPFVRSYEAELNRNIVDRLDPDYELAFLGLDALTPKELADLNEKRVANYMTIDEVRKELDLDPVPAFDPDKPGQLILSGPLLQLMQAKMTADQQAEQAAQQGPPGAGGAPGGEGAPTEEVDPLADLLDRADEQDAQKALVSNFEI